MDTGTPHSYPGLKTTILRWPSLESGMRVSPRFCPCFNTKSVRVQGKKSKRATLFLLPKGQRACPYWGGAVLQARPLVEAKRWKRSVQRDSLKGQHTTMSIRKSVYGVVFTYADIIERCTDYSHRKTCARPSLPCLCFARADEQDRLRFPFSSSSIPTHRVTTHHSPLSSLLCSLCWIFRTLLLMRTDWRMYCQLASVDASSVYPHAVASPPDIDPRWWQLSERE
ncbi:hypothetical protein BDP67DRAFT_514476, partial [Colletotrichum lupini]